MDTTADLDTVTGPAATAAAPATPAEPATASVRQPATPAEPATASVRQPAAAGPAAASPAGNASRTGKSSRAGKASRPGRGEKEQDSQVPELDWASRVQRLEAEVAGLRRAMRGRALIEQAKGLLAGTLDCSPEVAYEHLSRLSQHENRRLVDVAARILGTALPDGLDDPRPTPDAEAARQFDPAIYLATPDESGDVAPLPDAGTAALSAPDRVRLQTVVSAVEAAPTMADLADRLLREGAESLAADAVVIYLAEPDGALRMASCAGLPAQVASDWQRIPSAVPTVLGEALRSGRPQWFSGDNPRGYLLVGDGAARAGLPLHHAGRTFGVVEPIWQEHREFTDADRAYLSALAGAVAGRIWRLSRLVADVLAAPGHWLQSALDGVAAPILLLSPFRDETGAVVDFTVDFASSQAGHPYGQEPDELVGCRLLDVRPMLAAAGVFDGYRQALLTGVPWQRAAQTETILVDGRPRTALISRSAVRLGDGLLVSWQVHDAEAELARVAVVEELGKLGYAEWDLSTGVLRWSAGLYRILDRSPSRGPMSLDQITAMVLPEDLPDVEADVRALVAQRDPAEIQFRIGTRGGPRKLRVLVRPGYDDAGELTMVHAVVQDVTELQLRVAEAKRVEQAAAMRRMHKGGRSTT